MELLYIYQLETHGEEMAGYFLGIISIGGSLFVAYKCTRRCSQFCCIHLIELAEGYCFLTIDRLLKVSLNDLFKTFLKAN